MNKLYSVITKSLLFLSLLGVGGTLTAQTATGTFTVTTDRNWSNTIGATNTACNFCTINISGSAIFTINDPVTISNSIINVTNSSQLLIAANVVLTSNTMVNIGDPSSSPTNIAPGTASLFVSSGTTLRIEDPGSLIILANSNNKIIGSGSGSNGGRIVYQLNGSGTTFRLFSAGGNPVNTAPYVANPVSVVGPAKNTVNYIVPSVPFSSFFVTNSIILPITLVDFTASLNSNGSVGLSWATDEEENSSYFNVQRSANGGAWTNIGKVAAQGNSSVTTDYSFTDPAPVSGTDDYRLQATDLDGSYTYSPVKVIRTTTSQSAGFSVFPNPARDQVNVSLTAAVSDATIRLVDLSGKVLVEEQVTNAANTIVSIPVQAFVNGTYVLVVRSTNGTQYTGKVLIAH